jgi:hydroxyacylglutathione hydrolase
MILRPYHYYDRGCAAYLFGCGTLGRCAVGRPDLPGRARENAADLYTSLHEKLVTLPGDLEIFPGHFSGSLCGAGLSGQPTSTRAFERRWNPMLSMDREPFIDALVTAPAKPHEMEQILSFNRGQAQTGVPA